MSSSSESDVISKELQNLDLTYYNVNLMTDVFKVTIKYRRKIITKHCHCHIVICHLVGTKFKKKCFGMLRENPTEDLP